MDPCCNVVSKHTGAKVMSSITIGRAIICCLATTIFHVLDVAILSPGTLRHLVDSNGIHINLIWSYAFRYLMLFIFVVEIPLYSTLFYFVQKQNQARCGQWWRLKTILLGICIVGGIFFIIFTDDAVFIVSVGILAIIYDIYLLLVIKSYADDTACEE